VIIFICWSGLWSGEHAQGNSVSLWRKFTSWPLWNS